MKIIDVLCKIANGEEIKAKLKFKLGDIIISYYGINNYYHTPEYNIEYIDKGCTTHDFTLGMLIKCLNEEVEIIEEDKKIKRIQSNGEDLFSEYIGEWLHEEDNYTAYDELLMNKINEIVDYLNRENK